MTLSSESQRPVGRWRRFRQQPAWRQWAAWIIGVTVVFALIPDSDEPSKAPVATVTKPSTVMAPVDATTLYASVAKVFISQYNRVERSVNHDKTTYHLSRDATPHCKEDGDFYCQMSVDIVLFPDESWTYRVKRTGDCWTGRLTPLYGNNQSEIDDYRERDSMIATTEADIKQSLRESLRLRNVRGCANNVPRPLKGAPATQFIAAFSEQIVQREKPGRRLTTSCKSLGKQEIALAPDSYDFRCRTKMADGTAWDDRIGCFDAPPYESFDSCFEESGFLKRPPRELPAL